MQAYQNPVQRYHEVQAQTATPGEVLVALYDGTFRFLNAAARCQQEGRKAQASQLIGKAHAIISELYLALDDEKAPELCANLRGLYGFCLDRLMHASLRADQGAIQDVLRVLTPLREAWARAVPAAQAGKVAADL